MKTYYEDLGGQYLEHHGIKGMKWRRRKSKSERAKEKKASDIRETTLALKELEKRYGIKTGRTGSEYSSFKASNKMLPDDRARAIFNESKGRKKVGHMYDLSHYLNYKLRRKKKG